jgi:hypothetical protein
VLALQEVCGRSQFAAFLSSDALATVSSRA